MDRKNSPTTTRSTFDEGIFQSICAALNDSKPRRIPLSISSQLSIKEILEKLPQSLSQRFGLSLVEKQKDLQMLCSLMR